MLKTVKLTTVVSINERRRDICDKDCRFISRKFNLEKFKHEYKCILTESELLFDRNAGIYYRTDLCKFAGEY